MKFKVSSSLIQRSLGIFTFLLNSVSNGESIHESSFSHLIQYLIMSLSFQPQNDCAVVLYHQFWKSGGHVVLVI